MNIAHGPLVDLDGLLDGGSRRTADGVIHAELRFSPLDHGAGADTLDDVVGAVHADLDAAGSTGCDTRLVLCAARDDDPSLSCEIARLAARWAAGRVVGFALTGGDSGRLAGDHAAAFAIAADAGLGCVVDLGDADGVGQARSALDHCGPDRLGGGWHLVDDCVVDGGRITALGPTAAEVRDRGIPLEVGWSPDPAARMLFDAGFRITMTPHERAAAGFTEVELAACAERAAGAAFLPEPERDALVGAVRAGWSARPARLIHLAERDRWTAARSRSSYLPAEWDRDGFIHLSALHQLLTPANAFYRGRDDLIAVVVDAHHLGSAVVWEAGTGTVERFPHLYAALTPDAVLREVPISPGADGGFLLPPALVQAARSPLGG